MRRPVVTTGLIAALGAACVLPALIHPASAQTGQAAPAPIAGRTPTKPYLNMPETVDGQIPALLSQTGAFADARNLTPAPGLLPYDLYMAFWSDGAAKQRMVAIPEGKVGFSPDGEWTFPRGTVFVKTFALATDAQPDNVRRLETRLLVLDGNGGVYGVTYKWRADLSDADLVGPDGLDEDITIRDAAGKTQVQTWGYPSRENCTTCHNIHTAGQLGPKTRQMNFAIRYPDGTTENQISRWNRLGLFSTNVDLQSLGNYLTLARTDDASRSLEDRARSYLDVNCSQCHRPGGTVANFDARLTTPLADQNLINGAVLIDNGIDRARVVSPHDPWRSMIIRRTNTNDGTRMPPIARHTIDANGVALLRDWILSQPGRDVVAPPSLLPAGGDFKKSVTVTLASPDKGAQIHYTLDGSTPGTSDPVYTKPLKLDGPTVVRARAYKDGLTNSIVVQDTYVVDP